MTYARWLLAVAAFGSLTWSMCAERTPDNRPLAIVLSAPPITLDPVRITDADSLSAASSVHSSLSYGTTNGAIAPLIARSIHMSADGLRCSIELRPTQFWNGKPVTSQAVIRSIERLRASKHPHRWILDRIVGIAAFDSGQSKTISGLSSRGKSELSIAFSKPDPDFEKFISSTALMITGDIEDPSDDVAYDSNVVGAGPYRPISIAPGLALALERNPGFAALAPTPAAELNILGRAPNRLNAARLGRADILKVSGPMIHDAISIEGSKLTSRFPDMSILTAPANELVFLSINWSAEALSGIQLDDRPSVVRCLSNAIDRQRLVSSLYRGLASSAHLVVPPVLAPDQQAVGESSICPSLGRLTMLAADDADSRRLARFVQDQAREAGFTFSVRHIQLPQLISRLLKNEFDVALLWVENQVPGALLPWMAFFDETNPLSVLGHPLKWTAKELQTARSVLDADMRAQRYESIAKRVSSEQIRWVPLISRNAIYLIRNHLQAELDANGMLVMGSLSRAP